VAILLPFLEQCKKMNNPYERQNPWCKGALVPEGKVRNNNSREKHKELRSLRLT
jgi:hypothetical protein